MVDYSCYARQIGPYLEAFGPERIHVDSLERMERTPQAVLDEVCAFLGYAGRRSGRRRRPGSTSRPSASARCPCTGFWSTIPWPGRCATLVPKALRERIRRSRQIQDRPQLSPARRRALEEVFARDHAELRRMFPRAAHLDASYPFLAADERAARLSGDRRGPDRAQRGRAPGALPRLDPAGRGAPRLCRQRLDRWQRGAGPRGGGRGSWRST